MRWLLVIVLVHGLAPSIAEAMEAVVHLATTGHAAHSRACDDGAGQDPEHSCGATFHRCDCCAASPGTAAARAEVASPASARAPARDEAAVGFALRALDPPFRPPIR